MKILFTGGGTLGPVTPLLALVEAIKRLSDEAIEIAWVGTRKGPERRLVEEIGIKFFWIWAPKWRRYFDVRNLFVSFALLLATKIAWFKLLKMRPNIIVTAGGFVGVPVIWAGWWLRIPSMLHNQDVRWSLANKLVAPFVKKITYALPGTVPARWKSKAVWTGNPVRALVLKGNRGRGLQLCGFVDIGRQSLRGATEALPRHLPTILIIGGGTGAQRINEIVTEALPELTKRYQVIHLTGEGKGPLLNLPLDKGEKEGVARYRAFEFVTSEIADLYAAADVVVTRAGMGVLAELAALGKPMMIVPIPDSHQEENARYFEKSKAAAVLDQRSLDGKKLTEAVEALFGKLGAMQEMSERARALTKSNSAARVAEEVTSLARKFST